MAHVTSFGAMPSSMPLGFIAFALGAIAACATRPPISEPLPPSPPPAAPAPVITPDGAAESEKASRQAAIEAAIAASGRSAEDRELDSQRQPKQLLSFFGIEPGMRVAELAAGRGYTSELLARVVGQGGRVYGQNNKFILERFAQEPWSERLKQAELGNVVRIDSELEAPFPDSVGDLDAVLMVLFYHDTVWFETDREAMNRAVYRALKPGGIYGVVDHSAREGDGVSQAKTLHRIEESVVEAEVKAAGFRLIDSADFLRNPDDARDWNAAPSAAGERRGQSDRFVLKFQKPLLATVAQH